MYHAVGLAGHLRLLLQPIIPRFITRYNYLREQISRLSINGAYEPHASHNDDAAHDEGKFRGKFNIIFNQLLTICNF